MTAMRDSRRARKGRPTWSRWPIPDADLIEVLPHVHFIQTKFFEIDDDLRDLHIPWAEIFPLLESGWSGSLSSEYEGRRESLQGPRPGPTTAL